MNAQTVVDLMVLGMTDVAAIDLIESHKFFIKDGTGTAESAELIDMIIIAIDNMYGVGSYEKTVKYGVLPSEQ